MFMSLEVAAIANSSTSRKIKSKLRTFFFTDLFFVHFNLKEIVIRNTGQNNLKF